MARLSKINANKLKVKQEGHSGWRAHDGKNDIWMGLFSGHVWQSLGWHDIRQRYRRSVLGPFWFTLSTIIMVGVLGVLYSILLKQEIKDYLPFLGIGLVVWQYISSCFNEGGMVFISSTYIIKQIRMPLTVHVARMVWRNFIILMHSLPVLFIVFLFFGHRPSVELWLIIPALLILLLNGVWVGIVLGLACTRYRDILPLVGNIVQIAFFFTPVMWSPDLLTDRAWVAQLNPFYHLIELVRAPMLGKPLHPESWIWAIGIVIIGFVFAQLMMIWKRDRLTYWL